MPLETLSGLESLGSLPPSILAQVLDDLPTDDLLKVLYDWKLWARPEQLEPNDGHWLKWLIDTGRGWGKTRTGAETVRHYAEKGLVKNVAFVGATAADTRDIQIEGESGIIEISPPWF